MTTDLETQIENEQTLDNYFIPENELEELKREIDEYPIRPRNTKVMRIEFNIRPTEETSSSTSYETSVTECDINSPEDETLMFNAITTPECCLMQYDHIGISSITGENIYYDLAIVRTSKPKSYWVEHFS
jgi:hypothetical protein